MKGSWEHQAEEMAYAKDLGYSACLASEAKTGRAGRDGKKGLKREAGVRTQTQ